MVAVRAIQYITYDFWPLPSHSHPVMLCPNVQFGADNSVLQWLPWLLNSMNSSSVSLFRAPQCCRGLGLTVRNTIIDDSTIIWRWQWYWQIARPGLVLNSSSDGVVGVQSLDSISHSTVLKGTTFWPTFRMHWFQMWQAYAIILYIDCQLSSCSTIMSLKCF